MQESPHKYLNPKEKDLGRTSNQSECQVNIPSDLTGTYEALEKNIRTINPTKYPHNLTVIRVVPTLGLKNKTTGKPVTAYQSVKASAGKYFVLEVDYTEADTATAKSNNKPLRLAYYDGKKWVPFEGATLTNKVEKKTGYWRLELKEFIDPPIAWGN